MSLNSLYFTHQRKLIEAASADQKVDRLKLEAEAGNIASKITDIQKEIGAEAPTLLLAAAI
ncbi:MAG: hypothetical protein AAF291_11370 [Pseudomonadota bacterium]